ncbi:MAG: hypothetical protein COV29_02055 [Candidatus Yanofskybacteria bacterium CG10_big_fil_rev_8_21_14_0_10_36_16]|uniref:Methyltransferase type 11 domain-containing protein n=1 Tax=Candidatus Yanofskybacteria bacterium CG10_big_fil_rev_8_21_14_0_10_36_16 TaxID=1975096 RepID=A0A2J0Q7I1_9BACT|nr:MAG: hypothetical protein COV29_02055 [Candidatus Yanofskybacteria bacterium CG10_big_fil_rev_8_21_14_0_10_36_16]
MKSTNEEFAKIFDGIASHYNEISNPYIVSIRKNIFANWAEGKCIEVGAGTGEISRFLSQKYKVVATDISPQMVSEIKKRGIEAYVCDAEKLPFPNESFDTVISAEVIFYLDNPEKFISEANRVLKPGGRLLISCASNFPGKFYDKLRSTLRNLGIGGMYFDEDTLGEFMSVPKLKKMIVKNNFSIVEIKKSPVLPIASLTRLNKLLEKTLLHHFGIFIFTYAQKPIKAE